MDTQTMHFKVTHCARCASMSALVSMSCWSTNFSYCRTEMRHTARFPYSRPGIPRDTGEISIACGYSRLSSGGWDLRPPNRNRPTTVSQPPDERRLYPRAVKKSLSLVSLPQYNAWGTRAHLYRSTFFVSPCSWKQKFVRIAPLRCVHVKVSREISSQRGKANLHFTDIYSVVW